MKDTRYSGPYIYLLHFNVISFRHFFQTLTVKLQKLNILVLQTYNNSFLVKSCLLFNIPIECSIPHVNRNIWSKEQCNLFDISNTFTLGYCEAYLANWDAGTLSNSSCLIADNRLHTLYIVSSHPSEHLKEIIVFTLKYKCLWICHKVSKYFIITLFWYLHNRTSLYFSDKLLQVIDRTEQMRSLHTHRMFLGHDCRQKITYSGARLEEDHKSPYQRIILLEMSYHSKCRTFETIRTIRNVEC